MLSRFLKAEADNRKKQITTLQIFNDNVKEITEDSEYEVAFKSGKNHLVLRITLGTDFPNQKPLLVVTPLVNHPWVNKSGVVTSAPGLLNFAPHSDLGRVVQAIIREFQRNPPPVLENTMPSSSQQVLDNDNHASTSFSMFSSPSHHSKTQKSQTNDAPVHSGLFPELNLLSLDELQFLDECEERQAEFIDDLPIIRNQNSILEELIAQIEETAEDNLSKEEHLNQLRETVESQMHKAAKLDFENEKLYTIYQSLCEKFLPRNIQEELGKAAKTADDESEKIAESFLQGNLDVDKFLNMFLKSRSLYQLRKTKEERDRKSVV